MSGLVIASDNWSTKMTRRRAALQGAIWAGGALAGHKSSAFREIFAANQVAR